MRISIAKDALKDALSAACRATAEGNSSPELACVLVEAGGDGAVIEATDGTFSVRAAAAPHVAAEGRARVPAARLASLVRALPDGTGARGRQRLEGQRHRGPVPDPGERGEPGGVERRPDGRGLRARHRGRPGVGR